MPLTLDIPPELEAELARQAAEHDMGLGAYAASLLAIAAHPSAIRPETIQAMDIVELFAPLRGLNLDFSRNPSTGRPVDL